jgi:hypothetical protein
MAPAEDVKRMGRMSAGFINFMICASCKRHWRKKGNAGNELSQSNAEGKAAYFIHVCCVIIVGVVGNFMRLAHHFNIDTAPEAGVAMATTLKNWDFHEKAHVCRGTASVPCVL